MKFYPLAVIELEQNVPRQPVPWNIEYAIIVFIFGLEFNLTTIFESGKRVCMCVKILIFYIKVGSLKSFS